MKQKEFFIEWFNKNGLSIGVESVEYEYQQFCDTHFLRIYPSEINEAQHSQEPLSEMVIAFMERYPDSTMVLLDNGSLNKLEEPELIYHNILQFDLLSNNLNTNLFYEITETHFIENNMTVKSVTHNFQFINLFNEMDGILECDNALKYYVIAA